ncbi:MAG: Rrf2 family transcriptional regulator [Deltaproteobacteria bacterium]|jgi:Rrf2 family protein|nr:Rrf2 family transcriptional regulator [Deltaproteobacteria bacterium]
MKLAVNVRYAIRIIMKLHYAAGRMTMRELAERTGLSLRAVENIHSVLRRNGITRGTIGAGGGIVLLVPLPQLSLGRIITIFDDEVDCFVCFGDKANDCPNIRMCPRHARWIKISGQIQQALDEIYLDSILG